MSAESAPASGRPSVLASAGHSDGEDVYCDNADDITRASMSGKTKPGDVLGIDRDSVYVFIDMIVRTPR